MIPSWVWAIVAIAICLLLVIVTYLIYQKKRKPTLKKDDEEKKSDVLTPSPTFDPKSIRSQDTMQLYGQQFALVEPSQTALSPPPQREPKPCTLSDIPPNSLPKNRGVFSLSPQQETDDSTIQDSSSTTRTITPFQGTTDWRGPTPPWTQH